jgi:hypothetical protein
MRTHISTVNNFKVKNDNEWTVCAGGEARRCRARRGEKVQADGSQGPVRQTSWRWMMTDNECERPRQWRRRCCGAQPALTAASGSQSHAHSQYLVAVPSVLAARHPRPLRRQPAQLGAREHLASSLDHSYSICGEQPVGSAAARRTLPPPLACEC